MSQEMKQKIDSKKLNKPPGIDNFKDDSPVSSLCGKGEKKIILKVSNSKKYVEFDTEKNQEYHASTMLSNVATEDGFDLSTLWYSNEDIEEFRLQVKRAEAAVNDACGDIDIVRDIERCVQVVTRRQKEETISEAELASISVEMSSESTSLAQLYARVLEKDIKENSAVSYDLLLGIVNEVLYDDNRDCDCDCDDDDNDESSSIGTIDNNAGGEISDTTSDSKPTFAAGKHPLVDATKYDSTDPTGVGIPENLMMRKKNEPYLPSSEGQQPSLEYKSLECTTMTMSPENSNAMGSAATLINQKSQLGVGDGYNNGVATTSTTTSQSLPYAGAKRSLESLTTTATTEDASDLVWKAPPSNITGGRNVRRKRTTAMEETQDRCNVAHALISLARWEFRAHSIVPKP